MNADTPSTRSAVVALMGPTGAGKSTFINLLTKDANIRIGHDPESQTFDVSTSKYEELGFPLTLVDTPGFDDSRDGVTDTDILGKIADYLQEEGGRKLNGVIYLHRISDPRMSGMSRKNLRMFRELCGDHNLGNVLIVTTNWSRVGEQEGNDREAALAKGAFKPLIDVGAIMVRQDKEQESALSIVTQLVDKKPMILQIQEELNAGMALGDTSAGKVIVEEMKQTQEKHAKEMEDLKQEIDAAEKANDEGLKTELAEERQKMEETMARAVEDLKTLAMAQAARERHLTELIAKATTGREQSRAGNSGPEDTGMVSGGSGVRKAPRLQERIGQRTQGRAAYAERVSRFVRRIADWIRFMAHLVDFIVCVIRIVAHIVDGVADKIDGGSRTEDERLDVPSTPRTTTSSRGPSPVAREKNVTG